MADLKGKTLSSTLPATGGPVPPPPVFCPNITALRSTPCQDFLRCVCVQ